MSSGELISLRKDAVVANGSYMKTNCHSEIYKSLGQKLDLLFGFCCF